MADEEQLKRMFGEDGLANLKSHAELLNMSLASFIFMSQYEPVGLLESLKEAMLKKQREDEAAVR